MLLVLKTLKWFLVTIGTVLLIINLYGLTQSMRPATFLNDELRFGAKDVSMNLEEYRQAVIRQDDESDIEYAKRLTQVIADGTAHIHWEQYEPDKFHQRVPIWENWILYAMALFSGIPEFERYHFVTPSKSIERGIGICGDASMLMTSLLEDNGIEASIVTVPGHVLVTAEIEGQSKVYDPDFGVILPYSAPELIHNVEAASQLYVDAGYTIYDRRFFNKAFSQPHRLWDGPEHFITTKYYFEKVSYWLIWLIPLGALFLGYFRHPPK